MILINQYQDMDDVLDILLLLNEGRCGDQVEPVLWLGGESYGLIDQLTRLLTSSSCSFSMKGDVETR